MKKLQTPIKLNKGTRPTRSKRSGRRTNQTSHKLLLKAMTLHEKAITAIRVAQDDSKITKKVLWTGATAIIGVLFSACCWMLPTYIKAEYPQLAALLNMRVEAPCLSKGIDSSEKPASNTKTNQQRQKKHQSVE